MFNQHTTENQDGNLTGSIQHLRKNGARFVLCDHSKRAVDLGWQRRIPTTSDVLRHAPFGMIGLVPWSVGKSILDIDEGSPDRLAERWPPETILETLRGQHFVYSDLLGRGNAKWKAEGASGDVRGSRGYVVLHSAESVHRLAGVVGQQLALFPEEALIPARDMASTSLWQAARRASEAQGKAGAYNGLTSAQIVSSVQAEVERLNGKWLRPADEVERIAACIGKAAALSHERFMDRQRRKWTASAAKRGQRLGLPDILAAELRSDGLTVAQIAARLDVSRDKVKRSLARTGAKRPTTSATRPWEAMGISRAKWYRLGRPTT